MKWVAPLSDTEIQTLTDMQRFHPSRRARMRAHGLLLSHQGFSLRRIAAVYQVSRYAVAEWLERWQSAGLVGLYDHLVRDVLRASRQMNSTKSTSTCKSIPKI